jgi:hypothetical protein
VPFFRGLPQSFRQVSSGLPELVQKKAAVVSEPYLSGPWVCAACDTGVADDMMRRTERVDCHKSAHAAQAPSDAVDLTPVQGFHQLQWGAGWREAKGEYALPRAGPTDPGGDGWPPHERERTPAERIDSPCRAR